MHLASYQPLPIQRTQKANTQSPEVSIDMHLIQRRNRSSQAMLVSPFLNRCRIMARHTMGLRITDLLTFLIMRSLRLNNNLTTEWATTWLDRVQTTLCHLITHLLIWLIGQLCIRAYPKAYLKECLTGWLKECPRIYRKVCKVCRRVGRLEIIFLIMVTHQRSLPSHQQEFNGMWLCLLAQIGVW